MFQKRVPVWAKWWVFDSTRYAHDASLNPCSLPAQSCQTLCQYWKHQLSQLPPLLSLISALKTMVFQVRSKTSLPRRPLQKLSIWNSFSAFYYFFIFGDSIWCYIYCIIKVHLPWGVDLNHKNETDVKSKTYASLK